MEPEEPARDPEQDPDHGSDRDPELGPDPFTSEELTRIYREEVAAAADAGRRLTVLLAPYGTPHRPRRHRDGPAPGH